MQQQDGIIVTRNAIRFRPPQLKNSKFRDPPDISSFLATLGWFKRFMKRKALTLQHQIKIERKFAKQLEKSGVLQQIYHQFTEVSWT